ncbi:hypothetical protein GGH16_002980, partial [Coemansia sp. RSA 560]
RDTSLNRLNVSRDTSLNGLNVSRDTSLNGLNVGRDTVLQPQNSINCTSSKTQTYKQPAKQWMQVCEPKQLQC